MKVATGSCHRAVSNVVDNRAVVRVRAAPAAIALSLVLLLAIQARAQGVGFNGGATIDPSQVFAGTFIDSGLIAGHIRVRPGIDGAFGGDISAALIDLAFMYEIPFGATSPWSVFQGTGPTVSIERVGDEHHAHGGFIAVFGFAHQSGFFAEFKVSGGGGPDLRFGIGYTIRKKP
jgi:hypothetical protein